METPKQTVIKNFFKTGFTKKNNKKNFIKLWLQVDFFLEKDFIVDVWQCS